MLLKEEQWLYSTLALAAMGVHFNYNSILEGFWYLVQQISTL